MHTDHSATEAISEPNVIFLANFMFIYSLCSKITFVLHIDPDSKFTDEKYRILQLHSKLHRSILFINSRLMCSTYENRVIKMTIAS